MKQSFSFGNIDIPNLLLRKEDFIVFEEDIASIKEFINEYGLVTPLCVRPVRHHEYEILDGRKRFLASQELGMNRLPCIIYDYMDDTNARVYYNLLHPNAGEDNNVTEIMTNLSELIEKLYCCYAQLQSVVRTSKENNMTATILLDKIMLNMLNIRYDIQNSNWFKSKGNNSKIITYLNNVQNTIAIVGNKINVNNKSINEVYSEVNSMICDISNIFTTIKTMHIYRNGKLINNNCNET